MQRVAMTKSVLGYVTAIFVMAFWPATAAEEPFVWAPDLEVGAPLPELSAQDQNGDERTFNDLKGEKGLVLVFSRSFDW